MLKINEERLINDLNDLAKIGATPDGGVSRSALTPKDIEARAWYQAKIAEAGFDYAIDGAGNQSAIYYSNPKSEKRILAGSHLDSVPNGGRYDGALGVLVVFEALRTLKDNGIIPAITLEAVNFTDEEGALMGLMGSRAVVGDLSAEDFDRSKVGTVELEKRFENAGITRESMLTAKRDDALAWVELHIEQGTRLEESGLNIGVVNAIVGIRSINVTFTGEAAHAGTKPMHLRKDALWGASQFVLRARQLIMDKYTPGVCNVGKISAKPGAFNIVPAEVYCALEFRHGSHDELENMQADLLKLLDDTADEFGLTVSYEGTPEVNPAPMSNLVMEAIENASDALNLTHKRMLSFAGHDTQTMASIAPSAMFFVPSVDGISHNPKEYTTDADCINGSNVMLHTLLGLLDTLG
jgi:beta-ureidopropionase / N-carbamoyl-L-amino-acid hydrolase